MISVSARLPSKPYKVQLLFQSVDDRHIFILLGSKETSTAFYLISYHTVRVTNGDAIYAEQWVGSVSDV